MQLQDAAARQPGGGVGFGRLANGMGAWTDGDSGASAVGRHGSANGAWQTESQAVLERREEAWEAEERRMYMAERDVHAEVSRLTQQPQGLRMPVTPPPIAITVATAVSPTQFKATYQF